MAKSRKGWHVVSEKEFKQTKTLHDAGLTSGQISAVTNRNKNTVSVMCRFETLADYHQHLRDAKARQAASKLEAVAPALTDEEIEAATMADVAGEEVLTPAAVPSFPMPTAENDPYLAVMERQAVALEALVEAWANSGKKSGLFSK